MNSFEKEYGFSEEEWEQCIKVLTLLKNAPTHNPNNQLFGGLISKISKKAKKEFSKKAAIKQEDLKLVKTSLIVKNALENTSLYGEEFSTHKTTFQTIHENRKCYACFDVYNQIHSFYHRLCPNCADLNFKNRYRKVELKNRHVILTGGRVKVGYATALKLLRNEAHLTITTRFPALALAQFQKEKDFDSWKDNLAIYGLDLRDLKAVEAFITFYSNKHKKLDILINNAAQTIKYDQQYNQQLLQTEIRLQQSLKAANNIIKSTNQQHTPANNDSLTLFNTPLNRFGQPIDIRQKNSWNSKLEEIGIMELLEVNLINQISPYLLIKGFKPLLEASPFKERFIINVSSSEGQFSYKKKTVYHPHTNMTKAALNMLSLTAAKDFEQDGIYMNSVDVGWISTGAIESLRKEQFERGYIPPLDSVDGAARILHPIWEAIEKKTYFVAKLLKNYKIEDW